MASHREDTNDMARRRPYGERKPDAASAAEPHHFRPQEEDLDQYFIKFPTPNFRNEANAESDFVFVYNETNVPVVLLLGWAGCQDRYLMKYSRIYEDRGLITVRYTAPVENLFWKRAAMSKIGEKILKLIYDMNFDSHPIVVHAFSNGGAFLYQHIALAIKRSRRPLQIRGMIFDSAPGERRLIGLFRAVRAIYARDNRKCNYASAILITISLTMVWFAQEAYQAFRSLFLRTEATQCNPFHDLKNEPSDWPQLFLYSRADDIIPYKDIESFIDYRRKRGIDIVQRCFDGSEHVKLFIKYPREYVATVCEFINKCLSLSFAKYD